MANVSNIFIDQGSSFDISVDVTDNNGNAFDLTNYTAEAQVRKTYTSTNVTCTFSTSVNTSNGVVTLNLSDTVTAGVEPGRYVYDCVITSGSGEKTRIVEGQVTFTPGVTR